MSQQTPVVATSNTHVTGYKVVSILSAVLFLVQPILAGQFLFNGHHGLVHVHEVIGDILILTVFSQLVLAFLARKTLGFGLVGHNLALLILVFIQVGIGEAGKDHPSQLAYHIPLGVLLFGMGLFAPFMAFYDLKAQRR